MPADLFPSSFVEGILRLRIAARHRVMGLDRGEHTARRAGAGLDFRDYRPYQPGDDLRRVDWNVYRRSRRLTTRVYDEVERLAVHVLLDVSASMFFETPPRADAGRKMAAAICAAAFRQHDRVRVFPFGDELKTPIRASSRPGLPALLRELTRLEAAGPTTFDVVIRQFERMRLPAGLLVVVSDFFDQRGVDSMIAAIGRLRHRLALVQIVRATDREPQLAGEIRLLDCETDAPTDMRVDDATRSAYRAAYDRFQDGLDAFAIRRQAPLVRINADADILDQLRTLFPGGVLRL